MKGIARVFLNGAHLTRDIVTAFSAFLMLALYAALEMESTGMICLLFGYILEESRQFCQSYQTWLLYTTG